MTRARFVTLLVVFPLRAHKVVGTDIFQIVFTAGYAGIGQYAVYGFIFYTLAMGMLLGSLVGIQVGTLVTKVVPGATIRGFYALAVMSAFVNRVFALPRKLVSLDVLPLSANAAKAIETAGMYIFFVVLGSFAVWVFWTFFSNLRTLKGEDERGYGATEVQT